MPIRLFTSGTHNGFSFSNEDIASIAAKTAAESPERIPIVLGHPKNDLPVLGYIPKRAIEVYKEGDKMSLGFERDQADLGDEGVEIARELGKNKISIRLKEGKIKHIGLVKKAAVAENNEQDFAVLTGDFMAVNSLEECNRTTLETVLDAIRGVFKNSKTDFDMKEKDEEKQNAEFSALKKDVEGIGTKVDRLEKLLTGREEERRRKALTADFAAAEYSHLTDEQKAKAVDFCAKLESAEEVADYKSMLAAGNRKPEKPADGSVTLDFGKKGEEKSAEELIREQVSAVK